MSEFVPRVMAEFVPRVMADLREGLGVEDIARRHPDLTEIIVRRVIRELRVQGQLRPLYAAMMQDMEAAHG